jgi:hypothetical protein
MDMRLTQPPVCTDCTGLYNRVHSVVSVSKKVGLLMRGHDIDGFSLGGISSDT